MISFFITDTLENQLKITDLFFFITDTLENQLKIIDTVFPQMKICIFSYIEFYI